MEKYWKGGVAALLSQKKSLGCTNDVSQGKQNSKRHGQEEWETQCDHTVYENESVTPLSLDCDKVINRTGRKKKKKLSDEKDDENVCLKSRKYADEKFQRLKFDMAKTEKHENISKTDASHKEESLECQKSNTSKILMNVRDISFVENECKGPLQNKKSNNRNSNIDKSSSTIFVGNLPLSYDHKKVVKVFSKFGEVESARIRCVPVATANIKKKTSAITKKFHPNRNSAVAYVVFKSKDSVAKAIAENGMILNGHHLRIDTCVSKKRDSNKSVFVGGLPFDIEDDELWDLFKVCGEIEGVRIIRDDKVSMGKGFGYINFKSSASVELALKLNGREVKNRKINVERCMDKKKNSNPKKSVISNKKRKNKHEKWQAALPKKKLKQKSCEFDFQGRKCEQRQKKKKNRLTKDVIRKKHIKSVLLST